MEEHKSEGRLKATQDTQISQNLNNFYKLYYRPKDGLQNKRNSISYRAKSVNTILSAKNQQEMPNDLYTRQKRSLIDRMKEHQREKIKIQRNKIDKLSYRQVLAKQTKPQSIQNYFDKYSNKLQVDLQEYSKKNVGVKLAIQKCKDQKVKIKKVILSSKQSQQTKLDYLQLKKKDVEDDIRKEIKLIYEQFFKKQYQTQNSKGFEEFQHKIRITMELMHQQMFGTE